MQKTFFLLLFFCLIFYSTSQAKESVAQSKVLVFDFGGVIVDPDKTIFYNFIKRTFQVDEEGLENIRERFQCARKAKIPESIFWRQLADERNLCLPETWDSQYDDAILSSLNEIPGMRALIKDYKTQGFQVALLSNVQKEHALFLREHGYYDDFSPALLSCEIGADKPDPKAYQIMLRAVEADPENCIFIDDKQENVDAAKDLGIEAIRFFNLGQLKEELNLRLNY